MRSTAGHTPVRLCGLIFAAIPIFAIGPVGCRDPDAPQLPADVRIRPEWVTGEAAAALDTASGVMHIPTPDGLYISALTADSVAIAYLPILNTPGLFGNLQAQLEGDRGAPVDMANLHLCGVRSYEISPFTSFPLTVPAYVQRGWSSQWAIPLCGGDGTAQVEIGVSDSPRSYTLNGDSILFDTPQDASGVITLMGVPPRFPFGTPVTPAEAIRAVYEATGKQISTIPMAFNELNSGFGELAACASWQLSVEDPVTVRGTRTSTVWSTNTFFVHHSPACFSDTVVVDAALPDQPTALWLNVSTSGDSVSVAVTGPVRFDQIAVIR